MGLEPAFEILPGFDVVLERSRAGPDGLEVRLQNLVHEPFFVLEVVIKLPLARIRRFDNVIRAGGVNALFVEQVGGGSNDAKSGIRSLR